MVGPRVAMNKCLGVIALMGFFTTSIPGSAAEATVTTVNGKTLKLLGTGLREFLFIDIYRMSAYSESGSCEPSKIVYTNEIKSLRLAMLKSIPADRMQKNLRGTLEGALPEGKDNAVLHGKIDSFLSRLDKDLSAGTYVELTYVPGEGTFVKANGKRMGPATPGKDFAVLLWKAYFGGDTCCASLKQSILSECRK